MAFELSEGQATLFVNDKKGNAKAPAYRASAKIMGEEYELAFWPAKSGKAGCYTGNIKPKAKDPEQASPAPTQSPAPAAQAPKQPMDDEIPF